MPQRILITTPTGNVGLETLRALARLPERSSIHVTAASRTPGADRASLETLVDELVSFDFANPKTTQSTFNQIDRVLLIRPPQLADVSKYFVPLIDQMKQSKVGQVVFLSLQGAENNTVTPHHKIEVSCGSQAWIIPFSGPVSSCRT